MPITPLSVTPNSITSPSTFNADMDTHLSELPTMISEFNAELAANTSTGVDAAAAAVLAAAAAVSAHNEATAAAASALASGALVWVSGTTYPTTGAGSVVYDPNDYLVYRRIVAGAGTTPPSLDSTNWAPLTPSPVPAVVVVTATGTWTCPANVRRAKVTVVGGGGGSSVNSATNVTSGGGGGGTAIKWLTVTPGVAYTCTIGAGGAGGATTPSAGSAGGTSSFAGSGITTVFGGGGSGAAGSSTDGGVGINGDLNIRGGGATQGGSDVCRYMVGGSSHLAQPAPYGSAGTGYGGGGGSTLLGGTTGNAGSAGVIVIEY